MLKNTSETIQKTIETFESLKGEAEQRFQIACLQKDSETSQKQELRNKIVIIRLSLVALVKIKWW